MVHDAARPFVDPADIRKLRDEVLSAGHGAILAMPMADTVKEASPDRRILATRDRKSLWRAATPQAFRLSELLSALRRGDGRILRDGAHRTPGFRCSGQHAKL